MTWDELVEADERSLRFGGMGLLTGEKLTPASALARQQSAVAVELDPSVGPQTRAAVDRLRLMHTYGVLCYDLFTVVADHGLLVLELALAERFVEFHGGTVTVQSAKGERRELAAPSFDVFADAVKTLKGRRDWRIVLADRVRTTRLGVTMEPLLAWARASGLLDGQRNRVLESLLSEVRNGVAHPRANWTAPPTDSARQVRDLAEIANRLWGQRTPGGRLYPVPVRREPAVLTWSADRASRSIGSATWLGRPDPEERHRSCVVLLTSPGRPGGAEWDGMDWDAHYERTRYPTRLLWGPGSVTDAAQWWSAVAAPEPDAVVAWDRRLAVASGARVVDLDAVDTGDRPVPPDTSGTWPVVLADHPLDAVAHERHTSSDPGPTLGPCEVCHCEELVRGDWDDVTA